AIGRQSSNRATKRGTHMRRRCRRSTTPSFARTQSALRQRGRHEQHQKRTNPVVRETLPHLGEEESGETYGVSEESPLASAARNSRWRLVVRYCSRRRLLKNVFRFSGHCRKG